MILKKWLDIIQYPPSLRYDNSTGENDENLVICAGKFHVQIISYHPTFYHILIENVSI